MLIILKFCLTERSWEYLDDVKFRYNRLKDSEPLLHCLGGDGY